MIYAKALNITFRLFFDMGSILEKLWPISDPRRKDVVNLYSAALIRMVEREDKELLPRFLEDIYNVCKVARSDRGDFFRFLNDESEWMHGFLYVAMCESARSILGGEEFYENFVFHVLNSENHPTILHMPLIGMERFYKHAAKTNRSLNAITEIAVDKERSRKGEHYMLRHTIQDYKQELEQRIGPELTSEVLANDCLFTRLVITKSSQVVTGVASEIDELACESRGDEHCEYKLIYTPPSRWQRFKDFVRMPRTLAELQIDQIERDATIRKQTSELHEERQKTRRLLRHIAPPEQIKSMVEGTFTPEEVLATTLFADICDFSRYSIGKPAKELVDFLNLHFDRMQDVIDTQGGYACKYAGDQVMVVFGASFPNETHAISSVLCGLKMQERAAKSNGDPLELRVGINTGKITTAKIGASKNYRWDVIGEPINLAARLTDNGRSDAVTISESTKDRVKDFFNVRRSDELVMLKGYDEATYIYFVDRLRRVSECAPRVGENASYFRALEDEVDSIRLECLEKIDNVAYDAKDGDPLRSKTVALISYALVKELGYSIPYESILAAANLHEAGKGKILQSILNSRYSNPSEKERFQEEVMQKTLSVMEEAAPHVLPIIADFYGRRVGLPAKIIKASQIYCGMACPQRYKDRTVFSKKEVAEEMSAKSIPPEMIECMHAIGLL
jgi:class 3 adenylate cyclase